MDRGSGPVDGGYLFLNVDEKEQLISRFPSVRTYIRNFTNSEEFINGKQRFCIWLDDESVKTAIQIPDVQMRVENVRNIRLASTKKQTQMEVFTNLHLMPTTTEHKK